MRKRARCIYSAAFHRGDRSSSSKLLLLSSSQHSLTNYFSSLLLPASSFNPLPNSQQQSHQDAYFPDLHSSQRCRRRRRHCRPPQPRSHDQDPLPSARQLRFRVRRQDYVRYLHCHRQEAHWSGTTTSSCPFFLFNLILTHHRQPTNSPSPTSPRVSTPSSTPNPPLVSLPSAASGV